MHLHFGHREAVLAIPKADTCERSADGLTSLNRAAIFCALGMPYVLEVAIPRSLRSEALVTLIGGL